MTALARHPTAFAVQATGDVRRRLGAVNRLSLRATEDGWSLLTRDGVVVFRGLGLAGRRQCLQHAHDLGVLAVLS